MASKNVSPGTKTLKRRAPEPPARSRSQAPREDEPDDGAFEKIDAEAPTDTTRVDETRFAPPREDSEHEGSVTEFRRSLQAPLKTDMLYRRVVATAQQAYDFHEGWQARERGSCEVEYGKLRVVASFDAIEKMHGWVTARSDNFTVEVQGRFLARRRPDHILVDDFIPLPSFCQSLAYETSGPAERSERFGKAKMRTISPDDWKPHESRVYEHLGVFSRELQIAFDPLKVQVPFHSHYVKSLYQKGPSPGDTDHLHHLKWLYAPVTGLNILYSGVHPYSVALPHVFRPVAIGDDDDQARVNPADCRVIAKLTTGHVVSAAVPVDDPEGLVIGRDATCGLAVVDDSLSRKHVRIAWTPEGLLQVEDLGSKNGTFVDKRRITAPAIIRRPTRILAGDVGIDIRF